MPDAPDSSDAFIDYEKAPVAHAETGPLAGLTFAVKDIYDVAGYPTGCGNPTRRAESRPAERHAAPVAALLAAGARFAGKTHTVEFAFGLDGGNAHYGTPVNPVTPDRVPGGSSSGSVVAVGAGLVDLALGSDTGGSVRAPASFCGQIGLRTTFGRVAIDGTMPLATSLDTVGWFARTADIHQRVGAVLLGAAADGPPLTRLLVAEDAFDLLVGPGERAAMDAALTGVRPHFEATETIALAPGGLASWRDVFRATQGYEAWQAHGPWIERHPGALSDAGRERFEVASRVSREDYDRAAMDRRNIRDRVTGVLGEDAVIALPTMPTIAPLLTSGEVEREAFRHATLALTCPAGLSGVPQITLPLGAYEGAPMGLSLIGPRGRDRALLALAGAVLAED